MIILSLNVKGVSEHSKALALKRLFQYAHPDVFCIQETMVCGVCAIDVLIKILKSRDISVMDSVGKFGGLLCAWNMKFIKCVPFMSPTGICLECRCLGWDRAFILFNVYGPY